MNKEKLKKILKVVLVITLIVSVLFLISNKTVLADVGNNNSYSEYSSGDSDDGSGLFEIFYILVSIFGLGPAIVIMAIIIVILLIVKKKKNTPEAKVERHNQMAAQEAQQTIQAVNPAQSRIIAEKVRQNDPEFSEDAFTGWARQVYMKIQEAWTNRDWKCIRPFESDVLFNQHNMQLEDYIRNNKINKVEKVAIRYCGLSDYYEDGDKEVLIVELHATIRDYVVDCVTNQVLESDPNKDWFMKYTMKFNRKKGVTTSQAMSNKSTTNCPNCGAPIDITQTGQCEYCKTIITNGDHDWVLSDITSIK